MSESELPTIPEFLQEPGVVGIFMELEEDGKITEELADAIPNSPTTIGDRLHQGEELDLFETITRPSDHGNARRYVLTERGEEIRKAMVARGTDEVYQRYVDAVRELEVNKKSVAEYVADADFSDPRWPPERDPDTGRDLW